MKDILKNTKPNPSKLPGFFESTYIPQFDSGIKVKKLDNIKLADAFILENVFSFNECQELIKLMNTSTNFEEVGVQGMMDKKDERIGSLRTSIWSPDTADMIWNRISTAYPLCIPIVHCGPYTATDWYRELGYERNFLEEASFRAETVSPLLRFMKYGKGGQHYAHYDASYIYPGGEYRTLKSMVIYLTTNTGAATRFIDDKQQHLKIWDRNHTDWSRPVKDEEVIAKSECIGGNVLIFNHRLCHDVEQYLGDDSRMIIRGDIIYRINSVFSSK